MDLSVERVSRFRRNEAKSECISHGKFEPEIGLLMPKRQRNQIYCKETTPDG